LMVFQRIIFKDSLILKFLISYIKIHHK
jgi:hypothetical protein